MTAHISPILGRTRGHRPRLQTEWFLELGGRVHFILQESLFWLMEDDVKLFLRIVLPVLLIVPGACNWKEPRSTRAAAEEERNAADVAKEQRDAYVKSVDARLAEFDQKVDGLDKRADALTGAAKTDFQRAIDGLRAQRKTVAAKLDDLKRVSIQSWTTLKGEVDAALADLDRAYTNVSETYEKTGSAPKSTR